MEREARGEGGGRGGRGVERTEDDIVCDSWLNAK